MQLGGGELDRPSGDLHGHNAWWHTDKSELAKMQGSTKSLHCVK